MTLVRFGGIDGQTDWGIEILCAADCPRWQTCLPFCVVFDRFQSLRAARWFVRGGIFSVDRDADPAISFLHHRSVYESIHVSGDPVCGQIVRIIARTRHRGKYAIDAVYH